MKKLIPFLIIAAIAAGAYYFWRASDKIEVVVIEYRFDVDGKPATSSDFIAKDRVRRETEAWDGSFLDMVRLDKDEVWVLDEQKKTCDVLKLESTLKAAQMVSQLTLDECRADPNWAGQIHELESYMNGSYEVRSSPDTVSRQGYECREIKARIGSIVNMRALMATDSRIPESDRRASDALFAASIPLLAPAARHWADKKQQFGNLTVLSETRLNLPGLGLKAHVVQKLESIRVEKVDRSLFEIPKDYRVNRIGDD